VTSRDVGGALHKFCRQCGTECVTVQVQLARPASSRGFFSLLPGAFAYPLKGSGSWILLLATIVFSALQFISGGLFGILIKIIATGYLFCFMQNIIHATANEETQLPGLPGLDDAFGGFFRLAGCVLLSFGAAIVLGYFAVFQGEPMAGIAMIPAIIFGCIYFPMALLAVAMKDSVAACNPLVVIPAIFRAPLEYLVVVVVLGAVYGLYIFGTYLITVIFGPLGIITHSMSVLFALFGARSFWAFMDVYLLAINMHVLGLLYVTKKHQLGWFEH
jgi:hypothetical protein